MGSKDRGTLWGKLNSFECEYYYSAASINPIPAGVLENPSKSHVLCPNMTNDTSLESSCALLLESAEKFVQKLKNYTFLSSPWPCHFKYAKIFAKF